MISPSSPSVQVTSVTWTPSAAYLAIVAPVPMVSSSGWACTSSRRRSVMPRLSLAVCGSMSESFPRLHARTRRFTLGVPRGFTINFDRVLFLRSRSGVDPVTCLWELDLASGEERLLVDPLTLGASEENLPPEERARRER